ncbi:hypothetical protein ONA22_03345 [Mycoplasmopsis cynos]|uniref:hypothetical protein n=1 Tax=Mycoplasmopsis cynos TaxID=171284 RepID=UPI0024C895ED|nr:hypothetical protein [Mycoplasmopsis cynos]WAM03990.1 hypothetical protein ONA22_03345 [Mycoplasmopsis cynos]
MNIQLINNQLLIKEFYYSYLSDELKSLMTYKTFIQRLNQLGLHTIHATRRGKKIARESRKKFLMITLILKNFKNEVAKNEKKRIALNLKKNLSYGEIVEIDAQFEPYLKDEKPVYLYRAIDATTVCLLAVLFEE